MKRASSFNKRKIVNDPVYGFISIPDEFIFDVFEHPYFQRLRRIKQLGLTHLIYPGALHTRFHHSLGAMYLMQQAIETLQFKGHTISNEEKQGVLLAILLHDIGHTPYSHTLENRIIFGINHEELSELFMRQLNIEFDNKLSLTIEIFKNNYPKSFLHKLVSSQLDMDRLDFLKRDSFFTGVSEGVINTDRIIKMLTLHDDDIMVEAKGIYSVEKFIVARRLMYWQVYLHKTVVAAEKLLIKTLDRARYLALKKKELFTTPGLMKFLQKAYNKQDFIYKKNLLDDFAAIDDYDIFASIKVWCNHPDIILQTLSRQLVYRHLPKIEFRNEPFDSGYIHELKTKTAKYYNIGIDETDYFVYSDIVSNKAYNPVVDNIKLLYRDGNSVDISEASDQLNVKVLSETVSKYYLSHPKVIS